MKGRTARRRAIDKYVRRLHKTRPQSHYPSCVYREIVRGRHEIWSESDWTRWNSAIMRLVTVKPERTHSPL